MALKELKLDNFLAEGKIIQLIQEIITHLDNEADFSHLAGDKKTEATQRKISSILYEAARKIDSVIDN